MQISALEEYGVRCALQLARHHSDGALSATKIAELEGLSVEYVGKIMHLFRKQGVVKASRGNQGGFALIDEPKNITLHRVFEAMRSPRDVKTEFCNRFSGQNEVCTHHQGCSIRPVWSMINSYFDDVLRNLSLDELTQKESDTQKLVSRLASQKANALQSTLKSQFTTQIPVQETPNL